MDLNKFTIKSQEAIQQAQQLATAQFFALSIDEYDGNLQDYRVLVTWQPKKWLGVGLGYNQISVDVDVEKDSFDGSLDGTYRGPMLYYSASF